MTKLTHTNLWVLAQAFKTSSRISNRLPATDISHLRRCMNAGVIRVDGNELVLTENGEAALHHEAQS